MDFHLFSTTVPAHNLQQFAAALHGAWPFKECAYCHKFLRLEPGVNRANRLTCSHTCKQYLYNRRIESARQLHAQGRTVRQIAKELNVKPHGKKSSLEIVKTWIDKEHPCIGQPHSCPNNSWPVVKLTMPPSFSR